MWDVAGDIGGFYEIYFGYWFNILIILYNLQYFKNKVTGDMRIDSDEFK